MQHDPARRTAAALLNCSLLRREITKDITSGRRHIAKQVSW
ncbi:hypothetical protein [Rhodopseudomonas palustris]|nr:hypothetical protein [Rhodopseudomonas palustris]